MKHGMQSGARATIAHFPGRAAFALLVTLLVLGLGATTAWADDAGSEGYWKLVDTTVTTGEGGAIWGARYNYANEASELQHTQTYEQRSSSDDALWERAVCTSKCSAAPPGTIKPNETVSLTVYCEISDYWYKSHDVSDGYSMEAYLRAPSVSQSNIARVRMSPNSGIENPSASVSYSFAMPKGSSSGDRREIIFYGSNSDTRWTYEWMSDDLLVKPVTQNEYTTASNTPGETSSTGILPAIADDFDPTEGGLYTVLGAAALVTIGGVTFLRFRRKRNKDAQPKEKERKQEPQSAYRMLVYKDFGGELREGEPPREVCARIEEIVGGYVSPGNVLGAPVPGTTVSPGAQVKQRDDLTKLIKATGEAGLQVRPGGFNGKYQVAKVQVPKQPAGAPADPNRMPTVVFTFVNPEKTGTFTQKVAFRLAAEPRITFVGKARDGSFSPAYGSNRIGLLLDDAQGSPLYFEAEHFLKAPTSFELKSTDSRVFAKPERVVDPKRPDAFVYEAFVKNTLPFESIYGIWPLEAPLTVSAWNEEGERADAEASAFLWPEGIFVDTRQVLPERVFKDHLLVDSSDILLSAGTEYNIEGATVEVGVAYKNDEGAVLIDTPNEPADGAYLKLEPADDALSQEALNPKSSRIWYALGFFWHPAYSKDEPLGTLDLKPLMPLVSKHENFEYRGSVPIGYEKDGRQAKADIVFALRGLGSDMAEKDLKAERDRIYRLLAAYRPDDWSRIDAVLAKYGRQAEEDQQRLGTPEERHEAGQSAIQLVKSIAQIQSLQRMRAIRKMVYEAAEITQAHDRIKAESEASLYNGLYVAANAVRWADDIAFTAWWYAMVGPGAAQYVEPLMTPLKDWLLGYVEQCGLAAFDDEVSLRPEKYFTWDNLYENMIVKAIEGELLGMMAGAAATGGAALAKSPKTYIALGAIGCFFFYKNYTKFLVCNPSTGKTELDLWGALKSTMADFTMFGIKAIVSAFLARKFAAKMDAAAPKKELFHVDESAGPVDQFLQRKLKWLIEEPLLTIDEAAGRVFARTTKEVAGGMRNPDVFSAEIFSAKGSWTASLSGNEALEIWQAFYDASQQKGVDVVGSLRTPEGVDTVGDAAAAAESSFDRWVRSLGEFEMNAVTTKDEKTTVRISLLALCSILVDDLFEQCGLGFGVSFKGVLPEGVEYRNHDLLVCDITAIKGAQGEGEFLIDPPSSATGTSYDTSTSTGVDWGEDEGYGGSSGDGTGGSTDVDTGTDTSTGVF